MPGKINPRHVQQERRKNLAETPSKTAADDKDKR